MFKKCDHCDNEATVHETTVRNGIKVEKNLCEACAATQGIATQTNAPINELIKHYVLSHGVTSLPVPGKGAICPRCQTTFGEFRQHGLLGCPECYRVFESQLGPLIERAHDGGIKHAGKTPRRLHGGADHAGPKPISPAAPNPIVDLEAREERLRRMRKKLESAVAQEKYEEAARLRDELKKLNEPGQPPSLS